MLAALRAGRAASANTEHEDKSNVQAVPCRAEFYGVAFDHGVSQINVAGAIVVTLGNLPLASCRFYGPFVVERKAYADRKPVYDYTQFISG
jgi:hypothetical protein